MQERHGRDDSLSVGPFQGRAGRFKHFENKLAKFLTAVSLGLVGLSVSAGFKSGALFQPSSPIAMLMLIAYVAAAICCIESSWRHVSSALRIHDSPSLRSSWATAEYLQLYNFLRMSKSWVLLVMSRMNSKKLDSQASDNGMPVDVFVETVEEARFYTKALLNSAARNFEGFASQSASSPRTGQRFSGRITYGERSYHSDVSQKPIVGQYLLMGVAAMGEVRALQSLSKIRDELRTFFDLYSPSLSVSDQENGGFKVTLQNGTLSVSIERSQGESVLAVIS